MYYKILLTFLLVSLKYSTSAPTDSLSDEVELINPVNTNVGQPGSGSRRIPIFFTFGPGSRSDDETTSFGFPDFGFGGNDDESPFDFPGFGNVDNGDNERCGLLCRLLSNFQKQFNRVDKEIKRIHEQIDSNGNGNSTYREEVLPDGTVVKINRTIHSYNDDDGNTFYIHSSVHTLGDDRIEEEEEENSDAEFFLGDNDPTDNIIVEGPKKLTARYKRSPQSAADDNSDAFFQQRESTDLRQLRSDDIRANEISNPPRYGQVARIIAVPNGRPVVTYGHDTRVNDLISYDGQRGGLISTEPDSEFVERNQRGQIVPVRDGGYYGSQSRIE